MRATPALLILSVAAALLAGCGQKPAASDQASTPTEPASAPAEPAAPTPDQEKASLATLPAAYASADIANGKAKFTQCAACHTVGKGGPNMTGPNLYGIFGRKAGSVDGFSYSDDLKAAGWTWDAARLDAWIADPKKVLANTRMSFMGLKDPKDRADVIAYLKVATSEPGK
jgi:cytochrome c